MSKSCFKLVIAALTTSGVKPTPKPSADRKSPETLSTTLLRISGVEVGNKDLRKF